MTTVFYGCNNSNEEVMLVESVDDCQDKTGLSQRECEVAYKNAVAEAQRTGPKYSRRRDCEVEFGYDQCWRHEQGFFMPFIAGYLVSSVLDSRDRYNPVYHYGGSRHYGKIMMPNGTIVGRKGADHYSVPRDALTQKPTVTKTISRGGFGSVASAKSHWGGGKSSGRWGG